VLNPGSLGGASGTIPPLAAIHGFFILVGFQIFKYIHFTTGTYRYFLASNPAYYTQRIFGTADKIPTTS
jgi:hypothetical protein